MESEIEASREYYALTVTATDDGHVLWSPYTSFAGYSEGRPRRELRKACLVKPEVMAGLWTQLREPFMVVNDYWGLFAFLVLGGNALVDRAMAEARLADIVAEKETVQQSMLGYQTVSSFPAVALNHAPTPKTRMRILKRDGWRCAVCGRNPSENVDIQLHVHHVRPWGKGGATSDKNLVTLCHTCHTGLDPHEELALYRFTGGGLDELDNRLEEHLVGVRRYRELTRPVLEREREKFVQRERDKGSEGGS